MRRFLPLSALAAGALSLAACSSAPMGQSGAESGGGQSGSSGTSESVSDRGPLDEYVVALWGSNLPTQAEADEESVAIQELVVQCMAEAGFEYQIDYAPAQLYEPAGLGTPDFASKYGYGISQPPPTEEAPANPNEAIVLALDEEQQEAWADALWGPSITEEEYNALSQEEQMLWSQNTGCAGKAEQQFLADRQGEYAEAAADPEFAELITAINEYYSTDFMSTPTVANAVDMWTVCMATQGFDGLSSMEQPRISLQSEYESLFVDPETGAAITPDETTLSQFRAYEFDVAAADAQCLEATDAEKIIREESFAQQQAFVDEHKEQLDALLQKYGPNA